MIYLEKACKSLIFQGRDSLYLKIKKKYANIGDVPNKADTKANQNLKFCCQKIAIKIV